MLRARKSVLHLVANKTKMQEEITRLYPKRLIVSYYYVKLKIIIFALIGVFNEG